MKALSRRALFGFLAGGVAVLATGEANALSWGRKSCHQFRRDVLDQDAVVTARVTRILARVESEGGRSSEIEARVTRAITGAMQPGRTFLFTARIYELNGMNVGYIPDEGDDTVLFLVRRESARGGWAVESAMPESQYNGWAARRCAP